MNNWRLLLLALVAVVQPIASFTERNFDGRHQCCDRQSRPLLRDSPYGTHQISKTTEERRLSQRDDIREDRRHEIRHQDIATSRQSSDTLLRIRERDIREISPRSIVKSEYRENRIANEYNRERILSRAESRFDRTTGDIKRDEQNRRVVREYRGKRKVLESSRISRDEDLSRTRRGNERHSEYIRDNRREIRRSASQNRESRKFFQRTRDVADIREEPSDASKNRQQVRNRSDMIRRERSVINRDVRRSLDNNNERRVSEPRTYANRDTRILFQDTRAVNEVRGIQTRLNSQVKKGENTDARFVRSTRLTEEHQQREDNREFRDRIQSNERMVRKSASVETRMEFRTDEKRFKERQDDRINESLREGRDYVRLSKRRTNENRRAIRNDVRHVRDVRDANVREHRYDERLESRETSVIDNRKVGDNARLHQERNNDRRVNIRSTETIRESRREIRDNEKRLRERKSEIRRVVSNAEQGKTSRDNERRVRERNSEIGSAKRIYEIRDNQRSDRERNSESPREIMSAARMTQNHREMREIKSEGRREIRSAERMNDIRDKERRVTGRISESRREVRGTERMAEIHREIKNNEMRVRERNSESRRVIRRVERMNEIRYNEREVRTTERMAVNHREIRDNEMRLRERNNADRREIRSAERTNDNERRVIERNNDSRRQVRSAETIRVIRKDHEKQLRENRNIEKRSVENSGDMGNNRKELRDDERRFRSRNSENRIESRRYNARKIRDDTHVSREIRNAESGNRRVMSNRDLRQGYARSTNERRFDALRDNVALHRRARSTVLGQVRDIAERRLTRLPITFLNNDKTADKGTVDTRVRNVESAINRDNSVAATQKDRESYETVIAKWQYVFYTLQGIYVCSLLMQVFTPKTSQKLYTGNWWHLSTNRLIKVD